MPAVHRTAGAACVAAVWAALAAGADPPRAADPAGRRPNIILILTDDQGYGDLGRHGNPVIRTPHLDRLYDEAVRFEDFQVSPTCSPTRCAIMTGGHEFRSGVTHTIYERERMSLQAFTLAEALKGAGYATGIFGKWHLGDEDACQPGRRGFEEVFIHGAGGIGQTYPGSCGDAPGNRYFDPVILHNGTFVKTSGYCTDVFFDQAAAWIRDRSPGRPFFCLITPNAPHTPLEVPESYVRLYAGLPEVLAAAATRPGDAPRADVADQLARFLGMVTNIDDNVGRLLQRLEQWGIDRDTLVIFMNDNGGTIGCRIFNAGMKGAKGTPHYGGIRAMSLWRWPGTLAPGTVRALAAHVDLLPTLAALAGAKVPPEVAGRLEGRSLLPALVDPAGFTDDDRVLVTHVGRWPPGTPPAKYGPCSVRWRQFLLLPAGDRPPELYDVRADPGQTRDLAAARPEVVERLSRAYDRWWEEILPCLVNEDAYKTAPAVNPFKERYWRQFAGPGPNSVPPGLTAPAGASR